MRWHLSPAFLLCCLAALSPSAPAPKAPPAGLELRLRAVAPTVKRGQQARWEVVVVNRGRRPVTLVQPGDGSDRGWRTPIIEWLIDGQVEGANEAGRVEVKVKGAAKAAHVSKRELEPACLAGRGRRVARCGNINRLKAAEVFDLPPGQEARLSEWVGAPSLPAGTHKVAVRYLHIPALKWRGLPLGRHDEKAMAQVRSSRRLILESNVVEVTVQE